VLAGERGVDHAACAATSIEGARISSRRATSRLVDVADPLPAMAAEARRVLGAQGALT
jgi:hypothetical protein